MASASACIRLAGLPADRLGLEQRMARELTKAGFAQKGVEERVEQAGKAEGVA